MTRKNGIRCSTAFLAAAFCLLSAAGWALGETAPLIDRELFFGDPAVSGAQLSPDGKFISFIKPYNGVRNIYVKAIDEPFDKARPVTADERPVPGYFWSRDARYVLYVQDKGGDENFHVYAVNPADEPEAEKGVPPARDLTPIDGIRAFIYAVPKKTPGKIIVGLNDRDPAYHDLYRLDISSGDRQLIVKNTQKVAAYQLDLDGDVRLAVRQREDGGTDILRVDGEELIPVYSCSFLESCNPDRYHKDGKRVYMETNKGEDVNLSRLVLFNPETGEEELVESDPEGRVDFGSAVYTPDTDELAATVYVGDRVRIYPKEERVKKALDDWKKNLPEGEIAPVSVTADMKLLLVSVTRDVDPGSVYLYKLDSGETELLYKTRPKLPTEHLAPMKALRYGARDGFEIPAYLTLPKGVEGRNLPTVIFPHGGPWSRDTWGYDSYAQFLANRGYAVFQPNFRGSTGYGKKFLNAGNKEWGFGAMQHDITDGVKYLIDQGIADPEKIAIFGGSYGGYATLAGVTFTPDLYAAGIPYVAPSNLVTLIESFPAYWGPFMKIWHMRVGDPSVEADRADLMARSPLFKADQIKVPLLVVHGLNDPRVKKSESDQIVVALRNSGLEVDYLVAPDEGHGFRAPENRLALAAAMERFLAKHLGGRFQEDLSPETSQQLAKLTVKVDSVTLMDETKAAYARTAPLPSFASASIKPMTLAYEAKVEMRGQQMQIEVERRVQEAEMDGSPVWKIETNTKTPMGEGTDTTIVDRGKLTPLSRTASRGPVSIELNFSSDAVKGKAQIGPQEQPIDVALPAPAVSDGASLELALAALPLKEGYETTLRVFDALTQKVRPFSVRAVGVEELEVPAGTYETFKIVMEPLDGESGGGTYHVRAAEPRFVVRSETQLPAGAGGATVVSELKSVEVGAQVVSEGS